MSDLLNHLLDRTTISHLSSQVGAGESQIRSAVASALPLLLGGLTRNAASGEEARSLWSAVTRDHDGSILENLSSMLSEKAASEGEGILGHILGGKRPQVEEAVRKNTELDQDSVQQLLKLLAPLVMGALARVQSQENLQPEDLSGRLRQEMRQAKEHPETDFSLLSVLDSDGDGGVGDDVARIGGDLLKKLF